MNPLVPVHIAGGTAALAAGAIALFVAGKGTRLHAQAGTVFFAAMLVLAGTGAVMAAIEPERGTALVGLITLYLLATSWMAARRRDGVAGRFEIVGFAVGLTLALAMLGLGLTGLAAPNGRVDSLPAAVHFPFAALAALGAALDLNFIFRRRLAVRQRIARHLWRMSTALLIAAFSFFLGQQKVMPTGIQGSPFLFLPPLATLAAMLFWILRVRFARRWMTQPRRKESPMTPEPAPA